MATKSSPAAQLLGGDGPYLTSDGRRLSATDALYGTSSQIAAGKFPQTSRWPSLYLSGFLHPLDYIVISGVQLPLAEMPSGEGLELDISHRKTQGKQFAGLVQHGHKQHPTKIKLLLFRDESLGYRGDGVRHGKDWLLEYERIQPYIIARHLDKQEAKAIYYPTLHALGIDSLIFTKVPPIQKSHGHFFHVSLEGIDPRSVKDGKSKPVDSTKVLVSGKPVSPQVANVAAAAVAGANAILRQALGTGNGPASRKLGR